MQLQGVNLSQILPAVLGKMLVPQHRYKHFRRMVSVSDKHPFALTAWAVDLDHDHSFRRYTKDPDAVGMSVAGMSKREHADIIAYCRAHGAIHISSKRRFEDFLHGSLKPQVLNLPDDVRDLTFMENEIVVVGSTDMIDQALRWIARYRVRRHVVYCRSIPMAEIRSCVKDTNHRIVANTSEPGSFFVSSDTGDRLFELWLRG